MKTDALVQELIDSYGNWVSDGKRSQQSMGSMTKNLYPYDSIFSPIRVNHLVIKNRIVMAPMGNIDMCEETGRPNDKMLQYFFARAKGGTGLLTTGLIPISHGIDNSITEMGKLSYFPRIDRSRTVQAGWRDLAQGCHAFGSRIFIQLTPGLGRVGNPQCLVNELKFPVSASWNPNFYISQIPCARISDGKLKKIVKNTGQAAADAKACGLDGVYLHGHEGYLLEQMTNPAFNRRKMGRYANWKQFGIDLVTEIRNRTGPAYPIMYRIDLSLALNETYGSTMEKESALKKFTNGRSIEDTLEYMEDLVRAGVDMFDVDLGCYDNWWLPHPPAGMPAGCFLQISKYAKDYFNNKGIKSNAGVEVPIVAVGKLGYPDLAEQALRDNMCDMVMLGRPLLADPEWPNKVYAGKVEEICPCIGCQEGCINEFVDGGHPQCAVNPRTGFEDVHTAIPADAKIKKHIAVIGAGPAGCNFALQAAARGHKVDLYEKSGSIGGKMNPGSTPKGKFDFNNYRMYVEATVIKAAEEGMIDIFLNTECDLDTLKKKSYDTIVTAIGTKAAELNVPGYENMKTAQATELLENPELLGEAKKVVIIGGGVVGCETAYWLSFEKNMDVTVLEMLPYLMDGACTANRGHLIYYMKKNGVKLINMAMVKGFENSKVKISRNTHKNVPNPYNTWQPILPKNIENPLAPKVKDEYQEEFLDADLVVFAMGGKPDDSLYYALQEAHAAHEIYNIGDSFTAGRVLEANRAAYNLAVKL
ncbi:MAG: FAD-dependent oxidoreductase [Sedimentibacter saalensis]|uniref:FAD-dependent oxidoreductase n=1 Tax=Sedimentibacter saalensis TaxID=130788 RepID=UPI002B202486|nr:FAD-dependent oxidoreductase [Sedimentibacter saalensis]MEA5094131.1 FAD-dependent oxidoreductase [Sedimentibacter saalensis]